MNADYSDLEARYASTEAYIEKMSTGLVKSLIINGPPGVGKTYSVEAYLKKYSAKNYKMITGQMTPLSLYIHLYKNKDANKILVLDDIDSVFKKLEGVNILKAAMDTKTKRTISWSSPTHLLHAAGVPDSFDFNGGVILISNIGFEKSISNQGAHLNALKDRSFSISISDRSNESLFRQVCFMVIKKDLLKQFNLGMEKNIELLKFIEDNLANMHTVSLRVAFKLAMLISMDESNWKALAFDGLVKQ
jgi:hypothetical protein